MKLRARLTSGRGMQLYAATYSSVEIGALLDVLSEAGDLRIRNPVRQDRKGRFLHEIYVSESGVKKLQKILDGGFDEHGHFVLRVSRKGRRYSCQEVTETGYFRRCENMQATDDSIAIVKCAFIAGKNNWFGGFAEAGACPDQDTNDRP